ncbi:BadF/BadG/BcrA/BcrD ATPase family protein [Yoonia sp. GPGPB17]|uniref:BadF/BadG/BcrA/BcrD ATPase family protein n=1 Tax=Yoonia sp. GPGPB17 TaxID=3026147 RepID=UPI0030BB9E2E
MSDSSHTLIIGVDGGGTGCRVAIGTVTDGVVARAEGGRANVATDPEPAIRNVIATVEAAATSGGIPLERLKGAAAHLGLAGVMTARDARRVASALPYRHTTVTDDRPTALHGALGGQDGFLLSVGTGTIAAASTGGIYRSVGGWGFYVGDQASGSWLGQKCLRQVLLCHDKLAEHSDLTRDLLAKFQNDPNEIVAFSMSAMPGDYGLLAPDVVESARAGDPVGRKIMQSGADHLWQCLTALQFKAGNALCLAGGVGPHYAEYLPAVATADLRERRGDALDGAFDFALANLGKRVEVQI